MPLPLRGARSADKSFARLFKGGGIPKGGALWPRPQARNTPGRAAADCAVPQAIVA